jgi:nucleotide-binding universal stress UspA family protein
VQQEVVFANVLVPTDGSESAEEAAKLALRLVRGTDATIHALAVVDERFVVDEYDLAVEGAEREAETALDSVGDRGMAAGVDVVKHLRRGYPHEEILVAVDDYGADVVVMGTEGQTGVDRLLNLGSTAERVVRSAPVPVLTAPSGTE